MSNLENDSPLTLYTFFRHTKILRLSWKEIRATFMRKKTFNCSNVILAIMTKQGQIVRSSKDNK